MNIIWLNSSVVDLKNIEKYYYENASSEVAINIISAIYRTAEKISKNPEIGSVTSVDENFRKFNLKEYNYLIFYRVKAGDIEIGAVFDTRQRPDSLKLF